MLALLAAPQPQQAAAPNPWAAGNAAVARSVFVFAAAARPPSPRQATAPAAAPPCSRITGSCAVSLTCGGSLPPCFVLARESGGDYRVWNGKCYLPFGWLGAPCGRSTASGKWQVLRSTWAGYAGFVNAADAPPSVQDAFARHLWAGGRGCAHWSAC